jgi:hypothetical protein
MLRNQPDTALLELRCSVEASNCLAFDGVVFRGCCLRVSNASGGSLTNSALHSLQEQLAGNTLSSIRRKR